MDWGHSPDEIVRFEEWLFGNTRSHPKYANTENVEYFPNVNRKFAEQVIYVAWWSPAFWPPKATQARVRSLDDGEGSRDA